ncbi:MAG: GntR family transcriptional regulator [Verrucomicrobiota bacterium]
MVKAKTGYSTEQIYKNLAKRIAEGEFEDGDKLPSRRSLAAEYKVSPATVTNAVKRLRARQLVKHVDGHGLFFARPEKNQELDIPGLPPKLSRVAVWGRYLPPVKELSESNGILAAGAPIIDGIWGAAGHATQLVLAPQSVAETNDIRWLAEQDVDGVILVGGHPADWSIIDELDCPVVTCNYVPHETPVPSADYDNEGLVRDLVDRFVEAGHSRIGFVSSPVIVSDVLERMRTEFFSALIEHGLIYDARSYWQVIGQQSDDPTTSNIISSGELDRIWSDLPEPPTAVFAFQPHVLNSIAPTLDKLPGEVARMTVFNHPAEAFCPGYLNPHLELGRRLMSLLNEAVDGTRLVRHELFERPYYDPAEEGWH